MKTALITATILLVSVPALAETKPDTKPVAPSPPAPAPTPPYGRNITLAEAKIAIAAAEAEARKNGWTMVITVVEPNSAMVMSEKMDGTQYGSVDVARRKAETSAIFKRPSSYFQDAVKSGTLNSIFTGALAIEGGEPIVVDGTIIGAIGASGGSGAQDGQVARAGAAALAK